MSIKKILKAKMALPGVLLILLAILSVTSFITGAEAQEKTEDAPVEVEYEEIIKSEILDLVFNSSQSTLEMKYSMVNYTNEFTGDINYVVEFYKGDSLNDSGYIYDGLEMEMIHRGIVEGLKPNQEKKDSVFIDIPKNISNSNYFLRVIFTDNTTEYSDMTFTEEPVFIEGTGGLIGFINNGYLIRGDGQRAGDLTEGPLFRKDETLGVAIPLSENLGLSEYVFANNLIIDAKIYDVNNRSDVSVREYDNLNYRLSDENDSIVIEVQPWEGISSGPYDLYLNLRDNEGGEIAREFFVRWLVDGFTSRFAAVQTGTNYYQKNGRVDLQVEVASYTGDLGSKSVDMQAIFEDATGNTETFVKSVSLSGVDLVNFSDQSFTKEFYPVNLALSILDNGSVIANHEQKIDQTEIFVRDVETERNYDIIYYIVFVIFIFLISLIIKIKGFGIEASVLVLVLILISTVYFLFLNNQVNEVEAKYTTTYSWKTETNPNGNIGVCPQTASPKTSIKASCTTCLNGLQGSGDIAGSNFKLQGNGNGSQGHPYGAIYWGPFEGSVTVNANNTSKGWSKYASISAGSHCAGGTLGRNNYNVSCTVPNPVDGSCDATAESTYYESKNNLEQDTNSLCSTGGYSYIKESDGKFQWKCVGLHGTDNNPVTDDYCESSDHPFGNTSDTGPSDSDNPDNPDGAYLSCVVKNEVEETKSSYKPGEIITVIANINNAVSNISSAEYNWSGNFFNGVSTSAKNLSYSKQLDIPGRYYADVSAEYKGRTLPEIKCYSDVISKDGILISNAPRVEFDIPIKISDEDKKCAVEWSIADGATSTCAVIDEFGLPTIDMGKIVPDDSHKNYSPSKMKVPAGNSYKLKCTTTDTAAEVIDSGELLKCINPNFLEV